MIFLLLDLCCVQSITNEENKITYSVDTASMWEEFNTIEPSIEQNNDQPETTKIFITNYIAEANVTLSPALNNSVATCEIYLTQSDYIDENGVWKIVDNKYLADFYIYFYESYNNSANLQYIFVDNRAGAYCEL